MVIEQIQNFIFFIANGSFLLSQINMTLNEAKYVLAKLGFKLKDGYFCLCVTNVKVK